MITGTSPSVSYTAGCAAIFIEYLLVDNNYPNKVFVQKLRTLFRVGAVREEDQEYPNNNSGYGVLNIKNTFDIFR